MTSRFERFLPLSGIIAAVLATVSIALTISEPDISSDGAAALARHFAANQTPEAIAGVLSGYFAVLFLFFASGLRATLRSGEAGESSYSAVAFAGALLVAGAVATSGAIKLSLVQAADGDHRAAVEALGFLDQFSWLPFAAGAAGMLIASGLGGLRAAALPRWLAIASVVLGVVCLVPFGVIAAFFVLPLWLVATGAVLYRRRSMGREPVTDSGVVLAEQR